MAMKRLQLHKELIDVLESNYVYYQPPASIKLNYPCIIYSLNDMPSKYADDSKYIGHKKYMVTVIDEDPDSDIPDRVLTMPLCSFDRFYTADNMNHFVFELYY